MPPVLETTRLRLRLPRSNDLDDIHRLGNNPRVMQFITAGRTQNREEARRDLQKRMATNPLPLGYWVVETRPAGDFLGWIALKELDGSDKVEIGYRFLESAWGLGYATEGGKKVLDYAFRTLNLPAVYAVALPANRASIRVMEKLNMQFDGTGTYYGSRCVRYVVTQRAWQGARANS